MTLPTTSASALPTRLSQRTFNPGRILSPIPLVSRLLLTLANSCYNNCPDDPRASSAQNQVLVFCQQASRSDDISNLESSTGTESATGTLTEFEMFPESTEEVFATSSEEDIVSTTTTATQQNRASNTRTSNSADDEEGAAPNLMRNTGGMLLGVAGVMAIIL